MSGKIKDWIEYILLCAMIVIIGIHLFRWIGFDYMMKHNEDFRNDVIERAAEIINEYSPLPRERCLLIPSDVKKFHDCTGQCGFTVTACYRMEDDFKMEDLLFVDRRCWYGIVSYLIDHGIDIGEFLKL